MEGTKKILTEELSL